jgi:hypothetical protein
MDNIAAVFTVDSTDLKQKYEIHAKYNKSINKIEFECSCGVQFGQEMRKKCKHIDILGENMINFLSEKKSSNIKSLEEFDKISISKK